MGQRRLGQRRCEGDHDISVTHLGAGLARSACRMCGMVVLDPDAVEDGTVTAPGLFGPTRPTIFTVLAEEQRRSSNDPAPATAGPRFGFGAS